jgi:hypothetical protein
MGMMLDAVNEAEKSEKVEQKVEGLQSLIQKEWNAVYKEAITTAFEAYKHSQGQNAMKRLLFFLQLFIFV